MYHTLSRTESRPFFKMISHVSESLIISESIISILIVFGNSIVVLAIIRKELLHTVTNAFIGSLAAADILVGLFVSPYTVMAALNLPKNGLGCILLNYSLIVITNISILMLLAITIERFIAIRFPYIYVKHLTLPRAFTFIGFIWALGAIVALAVVKDWTIASQTLKDCNFQIVISSTYLVNCDLWAFYVVPLVVMLCIYTYIVIVVKKHLDESEKLSSAFLENDERKRREKIAFLKQVRVAKYFAVLIVVFAVLWLPAKLINVFGFLCEKRIVCFDYEKYGELAFLLISINSFVNPYLYAASNTRIANSIREILFLKTITEEEEGSKNSLKIIEKIETPSDISTEI